MAKFTAELTARRHEDGIMVSVDGSEEVLVTREGVDGHEQLFDWLASKLDEPTPTEEGAGFKYID